MEHIDELEALFSKIELFSMLCYSDKRTLIDSVDIGYFKNGESLYELKEGEKPSLYIIIKGVVSEKNADDEIVKIYRQNDYFDPKSLIENHFRNSFVVEEELIAYMIPQDIFLHVVYKNEKMENYCFRSISQKLDSHIQNSSEITNLMTSKVSEAYITEPLIEIGRAHV